MFDSCLYVSRSNLKISSCAREVGEIVKRAQDKNELLEITGSLIFTGTNFAQFIEGSTASIDRLMSNLRNDTRHSDVQVVARNQAQDRYFRDWRMAYSGPSTYVNRHISPLMEEIVHGTDLTIRGRRLFTLMKELNAQLG